MEKQKIGLVKILWRCLETKRKTSWGYVLVLGLIVLVTGLIYVARFTDRWTFGRPDVHSQTCSGSCTGFLEKIKPMNQALDFVTVWQSPSDRRQWAIMPAGQARVGQKVRLSTWAVHDLIAPYPDKILYLATPVPYP